MSEIKVPEGLCDENDEIVLTEWLFADGDHVTAGVPVVYLMVEKAQFEIEAPASGILRIATHADAVVKVNDAIGRVE